MDRQATHPRRRWHFGAVVILSAFGFAVNYLIAVGFDKRGAYNDWDVVFGADPNWYLPRLAEGSYSSKRHPLIHVFVSPPAWAGARLLNAVTGIDEATLRRRIVRLMAPCIGAIKTALLLRLSASLGLPLWFGVLIAFIDIASLSRLVFGSIPESFGATAAALVWTFYLASRALLHGETLPYTSWFICGLVGLGVTVTNIVPFAMLLLIALRPDLRGWKEAIKRCLTIAGFVVISGALLHLVSQLFVKPDPHFVAAAPAVSQAAAEPRRIGTPNKEATSFEHVRPYVRFQPAAVLGQLPLMAVSPFAGPVPRTIATHFPQRDYARSRAILKMPATQFTRESVLLFAVVMSALGLGAYGLFRAETRVRWLGFATGGILLFNVLLFTFWGGGNLLMYTLHWQPCLLILLLSGGFTSGRARRAAVTACTVLLIVEIIWNVRFLHFAWSALS